MMGSLSLSLSRGILGKGYNVPVRLFEEGLRVIRVVAEMCCVRGEGEGEGKGGGREEEECFALASDDKWEGEKKKKRKGARKGGGITAI